MGVTTATVKEFAKLLYAMARSDRDNLLCCMGFTGEGKTCFTYQLCKEYGKISKLGWDVNNITWGRKEFITWVNGEDPIKGNFKGQKPEYSAILFDELISAFNSKTWFSEDQKRAVSLLNMCRDRHLLIAGNVPSMWNLEAGFTTRVRYLVHIPIRGVAWVFQQESNPFNTDPWNKAQNTKKYRMGKNRPYKLPNFLFEINYPDWEDKEKEAYYQIRNKKRLVAQEDIKKDTPEKYTKIKLERDNLIKAMHLVYNISQKDIAKNTGIKKSQISRICLGIQ